MDIELKTEGFGEIEIWEGTQKEIDRFQSLKPVRTSIRGAFGNAVFYELYAEGVTVRYCEYYISKPAILKARTDLPAIELRIALKNQITGKWEGINDPSLQQDHFELSYTPFVKTRAEFKIANTYSTCDFHYDLAFLESMAKDFPVIDEYLESVNQEQAIQITANNYICTPAMKNAIDYIEHNPFSKRSQKYILENCAKEVLLSALERITEEEDPEKVFVLTDEHIDKLRKCKTIIEENILEMISLKFLCRKCELNEYVLKRGFKILFGYSPVRYHIKLRMDHAAKLLLENKLTIAEIAYTINYTSPGNFTIEFKKHFKCTPIYYRTHWKSFLK